jgi:hypothetical protein
MFWRKVQLLDGGDLLAILDPYGMIKIDRDNTLIWQTELGLHVHHDLDVGTDGSIYTLGKERRTITSIHPEVPVVDDLLLVLDPRGELEMALSIFDAFSASEVAGEVMSRLRHTARVLAQEGGGPLDAFHVNSIQIIPTRSEDPLAQSLLLCSPHLNSVFVVSLASKSVTWSWFGPWDRIHDARLLANGGLLLFHNSGYRVEGSRSEVLEYPGLRSGEPVWSYGHRLEDPKDAFFSGTSSMSDRLVSGNTLIVSTEEGRAVEVTPGGEVVWEYFNPHRAGDDNELIASLFQLERVPLDTVSSWLWPASEPD